MDFVRQNKQGNKHNPSPNTQNPLEHKCIYSFLVTLSADHASTVAPQTEHRSILGAVGSRKWEKRGHCVKTPSLQKEDALWEHMC